VRALLALLILAAARAAADEPPPEIRRIETTGATAYAPPDVERILRLRPGSRLRRPPEAIAASLEDRYHIDGYPAARVSGAFDAAEGALRLSVDEGRLVEVTAAGLPPGAARRAVEAAGLETGGVLREADVSLAFDRLESASGGALVRGESRVERVADGARLVLEPRALRGQAGLSIAAFSGAGRKNRVDDWTQPLGVTLTLFDRSRYNHTRVYARAAYATGPGDWRWHAGIARPFFAGDRLVVGYEHHDVTDSDDYWRGAGLDEAPGEAIWSQSFSRYYGRRGDEAFAFARIGERAQLGLSFRSDRYASLAVVNDAEEPNPPVDAGSMRSLVGTLRFEAGGPLFDDPGAEREAFLLRSLHGLAAAPPRRLRLEATLEHADASSLGGDFSFTRLVGVLRARHRAGTRHHLDARLLLGRGSDLPAQKRFALGGVGTLRAHPLAAFQGDRLLVASAEYGFDPFHRLPRLVAFWDGGEAWEAGAEGPGFKSDAGLGLRWPATGGAFLRLEWAWALDDELEDRSQTLFRVQLPF
jgi:hypothetical protein